VTFFHNLQQLWGDRTMDGIATAINLKVGQKISIYGNQDVAASFRPSVVLKRGI
jgi:hypothetical protein